MPEAARGKLTDGACSKSIECRPLINKAPLIGFTIGILMLRPLKGWLYESGVYVRVWGLGLRVHRAYVLGFRDYGSGGAHPAFTPNRGLRGA